MKKLFEKTGKEKNRNLKIIRIVIFVILALILVATLIYWYLLPILQKKSIEKTKQDIESYYNNEQYDLAMNLCDTLASKEDTTELQEKIVTKYIQALEQQGEHKQAYELLKKFNNISIENKAEIEQNYIISLIDENQKDEAIELLRNTEDLTEENISKIVKEYIEKTIYPKAYNELYSAMKNPSSLNVSKYAVSVWFYNTEKLGEEGSKASFTYNKDFPFFIAEVKFYYSGTNSYGGTVTNNSMYSYWGKINEDFSLDNVYLRWHF